MNNITSVKLTVSAFYGEKEELAVRCALQAPFTTPDELNTHVLALLLDSIKAYIKLREVRCEQPITAVSDMRFMLSAPLAFVVHAAFNDNTEALLTYTLVKDSNSVVFSTPDAQEGFPTLVCLKRATVQTPAVDETAAAENTGKEVKTHMEEPKKVEEQQPKTEEMVNMNNNINPVLAQILEQLGPEFQAEMVEKFMVSQAEEQAPAVETPVAEATPAPAPAPQPPVPPQPVIDTDSAPDWMKRAINKLTILSKTAFIGLLITERVRATDDNERKEIQALIDELHKDDVRWDKKTKPFIIAAKQWNNDEVNKAAQKAFELSLATRQKTAAATAWLGDSIMKAGQAVKDNADTVGKVVASPIQGAAQLMAKAPGKVEVKKVKAEPQY